MREAGGPLLPPVEEQMGVLTAIRAMLSVSTPLLKVAA